MQIHFTGRNLELTPSLKEFTEDKMRKLEHHDHQISKIDVTLSVEKIRHVAESTVHLNGIEFHAKAEAKDMHEAIDLLIDKLLAQVTKHKEKSTDHHR